MSDLRASLALGVTFVVLGSLFTLSPELLSHSPVGFERRGAMHHAWHYVVLIGGLTIVIGLALRDRVFEALGLAGCGAAVLLNLAGILTAAGDVSGFDIALRLVVLAWICARLLDIRREDR